MPGSSSWMPYAPKGVKGFDDDNSMMYVYYILFKSNESQFQ